MKGEKRLKEIQQRFLRTLKNASPENADRYTIEYKPFHPHYSTPQQEIQGRWKWEGSPEYQFVLIDKKNPSVDYPLMTIQWSEIARPNSYGFTKEMQEKYEGGPAFEPNIKEAIEALSKSEKKPRRGKPSKLETLSIISITALVLSLLFISGMTGNVIGASSSSVIGALFFLIGLGSAFWWFTKK